MFGVGVSFSLAIIYWFKIALIYAAASEVGGTSLINYKAYMYHLHPWSEIKAANYGLNLAVTFCRDYNKDARLHVYAMHTNNINKISHTTNILSRLTV